MSLFRANYYEKFMDLWEKDISQFLDKISKTNDVVSVVLDIPQNLSDFQKDQVKEGQKVLETMYGDIIFQIKCDFEEMYKTVSEEKVCSYIYTQDVITYKYWFQEVVESFPYCDQNVWNDFYYVSDCIHESISEMLRLRMNLRHGRVTYLSHGKEPSGYLIDSEMEPIYKNLCRFDSFLSKCKSNLTENTMGYINSD